MPGYQLDFVGDRDTCSTVPNLVLHNLYWYAISQFVRCEFDAEASQNPGDGSEQYALRKVYTDAEATAGGKGEMWPIAKLTDNLAVNGTDVIHVTAGVKDLWVWIARRVIVDGMDVDDNGGTLRNAIALVCIIPGGCVWDGERGGRTVSKGFQYNALHVLELLLWIGRTPRERSKHILI